MAYIGRQLARGENKLFDDISSSFNGSTTTFNLTVSSVATATATPYQLFVSLGGVMQKPNTDFTTAGNQITFTTAPAAGLSCWIMMQGDTIDQAAIPDSSVTPSKISGSNFAFSGDLRLKDADGSHYVGFASPTTVTTNKVWTLPAADGSASQYLQTNGSGVLSWATVSIGGATGIDFNDNVKARWGTGNDLEIFHNGSSNFILSDNHPLILESDSVILRSDTNEKYLEGTFNGAVELYHNNVKTFETTATGVSITGALTVSTNATITGNLTVNGTTTTVDSVTLSVKDKNIEMGVVSSPSDTTADGGGITLKGATDKTWNWVDANDAWTSSEHIHLPDAKDLYIGTDKDLRINHNGTSSSIITNSQHDFWILHGAESMAVFKADAEVALYHDNSKKFETTTGGINVTGAINVNGSPLSAAPTITATADGAIAINKACCINTNGTVSQIAETVTPSSITNNNTTNTSGGQYNFGDIEWLNDNDFVIGVRKTSDSSKSKQFFGKVNSGGTITLYGEEILATNYSNAYNIRFATDTSTNITLLLFNIEGDNSIYMKGGKSNSNSTGMTWGTGWWAGIGSGQYPCAVASDNNGSYMGAYRLNNGNMHYQEINVNASTLATSRSTGTNNSTFQATNAEDTMSMVYVPTLGMYWCIMDIGSDYFRSVWIKPNGIGTAPTVTTDNGVLTSAQIGIRPWLSFDPTSGKGLLTYRRGSGNRPCARVITFTGSSSSPAVPTLESEFVIQDAACSSIRHDWVRDSSSGNGKAVFYISQQSGGNTHIKCATISGTSLSDASNNLTLFSSVDYDSLAISANPSTGRVIVGTRDEGNSNRISVSCIDIPITTTNFTSENFVGFSAAAYSDTNTATINVVGNTTTQSSLTPAQKYYVQTDGTIALTADSQGSVFAGTALSSTKLLVKG